MRTQEPHITSPNTPPALLLNQRELAYQISQTNLDVSQLPTVGHVNRLTRWLHCVSFGNDNNRWPSLPYFRTLLQHVHNRPQLSVDELVDFAASEEGSMVIEQDKLDLRQTITSFEYHPEKLGIPPEYISDQSLASIFDIRKSTLLKYVAPSNLEFIEYRFGAPNKPQKRGYRGAKLFKRSDLLKALVWHTPGLETHDQS